MKKLSLIVVMILTTTSFLFAQKNTIRGNTKIIGNLEVTGISKLDNTPTDASPTLLLTIDNDTVKKIVTTALPYWKLTGNASTSYPTNFFGTTDNISVWLKSNNVTVAKLDSASNGFWINKKTSINCTGWFSPLAVVSDNNNTTISTRYSFNFIDGSINKNRTTYAQATDSSSLSFAFTETGKPIINLRDQIGNLVLNYDSTNNFILNTPTANNKLLSMYVSDVATTTAYWECRNMQSTAGILAPQMIMAGNTATSGNAVNEFRFMTSGDVAGHTGAVWNVYFAKGSSTALVNRPLTMWSNGITGTEVFKMDAAGYPYYKTLGGSATAIVTADATTGKLSTTPILTLYGISAVGTDAYALTLTGVTLTDGLSIVMKADVANTGACTLAVNAGTAYNIKVLHDQDPPDDYIEAGSMVTLVWDNTTTTWQCQTPDANP